MHYHADKVKYAFAKHEEEIEDKKKTLAFCGIGSHHQNGKEENCIKIQCNLARSVLAHAMCMRC